MLYSGKKRKVQICPELRLLAQELCRRLKEQGLPCDWRGEHIWLSPLGSKLEMRTKIRAAAGY
jgi:hypothetical protein